jgi:hypothetical protein
MNAMKTYAFVYGVPDPICDGIVCPKFPISCPFSSSMPDVESVHFKPECRSEHNTEEDVVPSEEEAKYPVRLAEFVAIVSFEIQDVWCVIGMGGETCL